VRLKENLLFPVALGTMTLLVLGLTLHSILMGTTVNDASGMVYTHYNNYLIFKHSFFHLLHHQDLFVLYPADHWDLYKYSPTFAMMIAPLAILPDIPGLIIWNLLNGLLLVTGIWKLPFRKDSFHLYILLFALLELTGSIQNSQSNGLITGLIVMAFAMMERKQMMVAALLLAISVFIKPFGVVAFAMFLMHPQRWRGLIWSAIWMILLLLLPLLVISPEELLRQYESWFRMLSADRSETPPLSVGGWLQTWFGWNLHPFLLPPAGVLLLLLPLIRFNNYREISYRLLFLASLLIWVVIFNHRAESPTYILAVTGVAIWFFTTERRPFVDRLLFVTVFVVSILGSSDLVPPDIRTNLTEPYVFKAVPVILVWFRICLEQLIYRPKSLTA